MPLLKAIKVPFNFVRIRLKVKAEVEGIFQLKWQEV